MSKRTLDNPRWERFAQELAKGKSQAEAYETAGYEPSEPHASRLARNGKVSARLAELQESGAKRAEITVDVIKDMLMEDRTLARDLGQSAAAVSATEKLAKLYGLMIDRKTIAGEDGGAPILHRIERIIVDPRPAGCDDA